MRTFLFGLVAAVFAVLMGLPSPAAATDARQAITLCDKNPKCSFAVRDNGSVDLTVKDCGSGTCHINCPQEGQCSCDICIQAGGGKVTNFPAGSVLNTLSITSGGSKACSRTGTTSGH